MNRPQNFLRAALFLLFAVVVFFACQDENVTDTPNNAPNEPSNPSPAHLDSNVTVSAQLSWSCTDPDGDPMNYDIYLDTLNPPDLLEDRWPNRNYDPGSDLLYEKTYYWKIVSRDINSAETEGPIWSFKTERGSGLYLVGTCQTTETALNVFFIRDEVYVVEGDYGMEIFDVSTPQTSILIGLYQRPYINAVDVTVVGNYAFVADANSGLLIVDISNPFSPYLFELVSLPFSARAVHVEDSIRVYVACDTSGLQIVNVQYLQSPFIEGSLPLYDVPVEAVFVHGNYAYLGCGTRGLYIADISDPENPEFIYNYDTPGTVKSAHVVEADGIVSAHMADGNFGYRVVDFTQPTSPTLISLLGPPGFPGFTYAAQKIGQYAYLAVNDVGLVIVNDANPPEIITYYNTPGQARDVEVGGGYIFVADGTDGVAILEHVE
jgi:hypothetical protein